MQHRREIQRIPLLASPPKSTRTPTVKRFSDILVKATLLLLAFWGLDKSGLALDLQAPYPGRSAISVLFVWRYDVCRWHRQWLHLHTVGNRLASI